MYKEMRKKDRQKSEPEAYEFLNNACWGVLSLAAEGLPYGVPLSHAVLGKTIYAHCALEGQKLDFIRVNPAGCFTAVPYAETIRNKGAVKYDCVMAFGPVRLVEGDEERLKAFDAINAKYTESFDLGRSFVEKWGKDAAVIALDIERIIAKSARS